MSYITPEVVQEVKRMDLLTDMKNYEPYDFPYHKKLLRDNNLPDIRWHDL